MATYYVVHPEQYIQSRKIMFGMIQPFNSWQPRGDFSVLIPMWGTTFHALSVVSRREAPPHRDPQTASQWFDFLISAGYYEEAFLYIPSLRTQVFLFPGTLCAFSGRLLRHSVTHAYSANTELHAECDTPERVCLAYYLRTQIAINLGIELGSFSLGAPMNWDGECYSVVAPDI